MRMRRNGNLGASGQKNLTTPFAPVTSISYFHYPMTFSAYI